MYLLDFSAWEALQLKKPGKSEALISVKLPVERTRVRLLTRLVSQRCRDDSSLIPDTVCILKLHRDLGAHSLLIHAHSAHFYWFSDILLAEL